jgi:hypothetical protein
MRGREDFPLKGIYTKDKIISILEEAKTIADLEKIFKGLDLKTPFDLMYSPRGSEELHNNAFFAVFEVFIENLNLGEISDDDGFSQSLYDNFFRIIETEKKALPKEVIVNGKRIP